MVFLNVPKIYRLVNFDFFGYSLIWLMNPDSLSSSDILSSLAETYLPYSPSFPLSSSWKSSGVAWRTRQSIPAKPLKFPGDPLKLPVSKLQVNSTPIVGPDSSNKSAAAFDRPSSNPGSKYNTNSNCQSLKPVLKDI